jgi:hypothetical protein
MWRSDPPAQYIFSLTSTQQARARSSEPYGTSLNNSVHIRSGLQDRGIHAKTGPTRRSWCTPSCDDPWDGTSRHIQGRQRPAGFPGSTGFPAPPNRDGLLRVTVTLQSCSLPHEVGSQGDCCSDAKTAHGVFSQLQSAPSPSWTTFQNRYRSILYEEDRYLLELVRYIHLNPLRAKVVGDPRELARYPYSGHSALLGNIERSWQDVGYVLRSFGKRISSARKRYLSFVEAGVAQGRRDDLVGGGLIRSLGGWAEVKGERGKPWIASRGTSVSWEETTL